MRQAGAPAPRLQAHLARQPGRIDKLDLSASAGVSTFAYLILTNIPDGHCYVSFGSITGHVGSELRCPLLPRKQALVSASRMSPQSHVAHMARGQERQSIIDALPGRESGKSKDWNEGFDAAIAGVIAVLVE
ncbi:MAG: hypothetical protein WCE79_01070 [Xanthobacteraceae bacterium]